MTSGAHFSKSYNSATSELKKKKKNQEKFSFKKVIIKKQFDFEMKTRRCVFVRSSKNVKTQDIGFLYPPSVYVHVQQLVELSTCMREQFQDTTFEEGKDEII